MERSTQVNALVLRVVADADPDQRLRALSVLRREIDSIETELAAEAVRAGMSWRQIGNAIGVSKQAAHRRHSPSVALRKGRGSRQGAASRGRLGDGRSHTDEVAVSLPARRAVRVARQEAARMGQAEVGTEHLLLGVLQCGDDEATGVLDRLGVTLSAARDAIEPTSEMKLAAAREAHAVAQQGTGGATVTPVTRRILERALTRSAMRESKELTAVDLLSSILAHKEVGATRTLTTLGIDADRARDEIGQATTQVNARQRASRRTRAH